MNTLSLSSYPAEWVSNSTAKPNAAFKADLGTDLPEPLPSSNAGLNTSLPEITLVPTIPEDVWFAAIDKQMTKECQARHLFQAALVSIYGGITQLQEKIALERPDIAAQDMAVDLPKKTTAEDIFKTMPEPNPARGIFYTVPPFSIAQDEAKMANLKEEGLFVTDTLTHSSWDFTMKQGKIVVNSAQLTGEQIHWIEKQLNDNKDFTDSIKFAYTQVINFYEKSSDPVLTGQSFSHSEQYSLVADQLQKGIIPFKMLMAQAMGKSDWIVNSIGENFSVFGMQDYFHSGIESVQGYLTADEAPEKLSSLHIIA
jgi:hypothetical protein